MTGARETWPGIVGAGDEAFAAGGWGSSESDSYRSVVEWWRISFGLRNWSAEQGVRVLRQLHLEEYQGG